MNDKRQTEESEIRCFTPEIDTGFKVIKTATYYNIVIH